MRPLLAALLLLALGGCGLGPYETLPRPAFRKAEDINIPRIGVCYNALFTKPEDVREVAKEACNFIGTPRLAEQDMRFFCPVLTPTRATFDCMPEE
jgi:hypothetical protein